MEVWVKLMNDHSSKLRDHNFSPLNAFFIIVCFFNSSVLPAVIHLNNLFLG